VTTRAAPRRQGRFPNPFGRGRQAQEERAAFAFLLPWLAGLVLLLAIPLAWSVFISLTDDSLFELVTGNFVGTANYERILFDDRLFRQSVGVTFRWVLLSTPLFMVAGLALALLLNQKLPLMNLFRTVLYIPAVLSGVAVALLWAVLLNSELGAVNQVLRGVGVENPPRWFEDPSWAMPGIALMGLWGVGGGAIIYLAGLQNIPPHLYEAAEIDGAGPVAKFRHVTLPMLSPTMFFVLVNAVVDALLVFGPIYVLSSGGATGGPANSLLFYMYYLYRKGFVDGELGYAAALSWILTLVGILIVWAVFRLEKRFVFYEADGRA
jgi:multiple sugar transport system permease protein